MAFHEPYYTTQSSNSLSNYFQSHLESVFYQYAVDLVFSGHIHAYERSYPVYKNVVRAANALTAYTRKRQPPEAR